MAIMMLLLGKVTSYIILNGKTQIQCDITTRNKENANGQSWDELSALGEAVKQGSAKPEEFVVLFTGACRGACVLIDYIRYTIGLVMPNIHDKEEKIWPLNIVFSIS